MFQSYTQGEARHQRGTVICPKCGEVNSSNFLFCGMCGTMLEPARKATAPVPLAPAQAPLPPPAAKNPQPAPRSVTAPASAPPVSAPATPPRKPVAEAVPPIGGPSLLGLDQPGGDALPERAFSSLEAYGEAGTSKSKGARLLLLLLLLAALGGGYWWTYTNYLKVSDNRKPAAPSSAPASDDSVKTSPANPSPEHEQLPVRSSAPAAPPLITPEPPSAKASAPVERATAPPAATPPAATARHEVSATRLPAAEPADDSGDALFRRGERYLYGRGGAQDCTNALKYLKMASDKQNAKARSAMGTMYATGHCVTRDLPTAYHWFALALRADPNNSVVEKNLSAVWNQMTPPERQLATKSQ